MTRPAIHRPTLAAPLPTLLLSLLLAAGLPLAGVWAPQAQAAVYGFLQQGAVRYFRGEDAELMMQNLEAALSAPTDDAPHEWRNPATGSHGRAEVLKRFEHDGMACRRVRVTNHARGIDDTATADMCQVDGAWKVLRLPE